MSKKFATVISGFANLLTLPLKHHRRMETKATAAELLAATIPIDTAAGKILFYTNTQRAYHYPWFFHEDEPETLEWIDSFPPDACLWDVGANIGTFSLYAGLRADVSVLAFEPSASSYGAFVKNIEINSMDDRIAAYCVAFCERTQLNTLNMEDTEAGHSMHGFGTELNAYDHTIKTRFRQAAVGYSIDDFLKTFNPRPPTHLKIDVDGIEADILRGAHDLLQSKMLQSVLIEVMDDVESLRNREIIELLEASGFVAQPKSSNQVRNMIFTR